MSYQHINSLAYVLNFFKIETISHLHMFYFFKSIYFILYLHMFIFATEQDLCIT
jgi:hypothetical protein